MNFVGQAAAITGAGGGIGRATAFAFAEAGAAVGLCDVDKASVHDTAQAIEAKGGRAVPVVADVADPIAARVFVDSVAQTFGRLDVLVNNAGISGEEVGFLDTAETAWRRILEVNLFGHMVCAQAAARHMRVAGGAIVNTASVLAFATLPRGVAYVTSKAAILGFTKVLAHELGRHRIRVNCVAPGSTDTEMMWTGLGADEKAQAVAEVAKAQPLGRVGQPADIAAATLFLASDRASFITGECLLVDGGLLTRIATIR